MPSSPLRLHFGHRCGQPGNPVAPAGMRSVSKYAVVRFLPQRLPKRQHGVEVIPSLCHQPHAQSVGLILGAFRRRFQLVVAKDVVRNFMRHYRRERIISGRECHHPVGNLDIIAIGLCRTDTAAHNLKPGPATWRCRDTHLQHRAIPPNIETRHPAR